MLQDHDVIATMTLAWRDKLQGAVTVLLVVPPLETRNPFTSLLEALEGLVRKARVILHCLEQGFGIGVVVAD